MDLRLFSSVLVAGLLAACIAVPAAAQYDFEGIPLTVTAQGTVPGDLLTFGTYGLANPPATLRFELPAAPRYARVYTGIWGGTEKYTGWTTLTVNNIRNVKYSLNGDRDRNRDVYEAGHGIYWIGYDATGILRKGSNEIVVTTSKNDPGNRLDGRVYAVVVVAAVDNPSGSETQYWIAEGNENLHGEGWAGSNPTRHDEANVTFGGADLRGLTGANLSVLLLAGGKGQPDYVRFNNRYLGIPIRVVNGFNVTDIGNEISFDAEGGSGIDARYTDAEVFRVGNIVTESSTVRFIRGIDLNGDGTITTTGDAAEGEDYIHPVLAILAIRKDPGSSGTDLALDSVRADNAYAGESATLTADVRNYGIPPNAPVTVSFAVDDRIVNTTRIVLDPGGITRVSVPWQAVTGTCTLSAEVAAPGDVRPGNNRAERRITIGTPPDIGLSVGNPVRKDAAAGAGTARSPLSLLPAVEAICAVFLLIRRRSPGSGAVSVVLLFCTLAVAGCPAAPAAPAADIREYLLPVMITNSGGSDAPPFTVTAYLDGEKIAERRITDGVPAGSSVSVAIPVFTSPGSHELKIVADEAGVAKDQHRSDNLVQGRYDFPQ